MNPDKPGGFVHALAFLQQGPRMGEAFRGEGRGNHEQADRKPLTIDEMNEIAAKGWAGELDDESFKEQVQEALDDTRPTVPHKQVMAEAQALIDTKKKGQGDE